MAAQEVDRRRNDPLLPRLKGHRNGAARTFGIFGGLRIDERDRNGLVVRIREEELALEPAVLHEHRQYLQPRSPAHRHGGHV